jgi:hypothetical protein
MRFAPPLALVVIATCTPGGAWENGGEAIAYAMEPEGGGGIHELYVVNAGSTRPWNTAVRSGS